MKFSNSKLCRVLLASMLLGGYPLVANVRVYNLENFVEPNQKKGAKAENFGPGTYNFKKDKQHKDWNNRITSLKIPPGYAVTLFENQMKGYTRTYFQDVKKLPGKLNDDASAMIVTAPAENVNAGRVYIVGTQKSYSPTELRAELAASGRTLVNTKTLGANQCTVVYPNTGKTGLAIDMGGLTCAVDDKKGGVEISLIPVYGGCNLAQGGVGGACEVGIVAISVKIELPGGFSNDYTMKGPSAEQCTALSREMTCLSAGADLASAATEISDSHGNAVGAGVSVGVGAGLDTKMDGWTLSSAIDLNLGIGAKVTFSINFKDDGKAIYKATQAGYVKVRNNIVGAGSRVITAFPKDAALDKTRILGKKIIGTWKKGSKEITKASKKAEAGLKSLGDDDTWKSVGDTLEDGANAIAHFFSSWF